MEERWPWLWGEEAACHMSLQCPEKAQVCKGRWDGPRFRRGRKQALPVPATLGATELVNGVHTINVNGYIWT